MLTKELCEKAAKEEVGHEVGAGRYNTVPANDLEVLLKGVRKLQWSLDHVGLGQDNDGGRQLARIESEILEALKRASVNAAQGE